MGESVAVDAERCRRLGEFLKTLQFPEAKEEDIPGDLSPSDLRMLYFVVVAICHQTTPLGKPRLEGMVNGRLRYGWDYLRERWLGAAKADPYILTPGWLMFARSSNVASILYDNERKRAAHITDPAGRASLLRDIGLKMKRDGVQHVDEYYDLSGGYISDSKDYRPGSDDLQFGLMSLLSRFEAYGKDPVKKKLTYFLILMNRYGFWEYRDIRHLGAPVDYHEMRLHLRLGTIKITEQELVAKVAQGSVLNSDEDVRIRSAIYEAIFKIADASGRTPPDLHYFFWNMARNCCRRDETHCRQCGKHGSLPERYEALLVDRRCIFSDCCASAAMPHSEKPKEPVADTDLY